jgi:hypothetical protein
MRTGMTNGEQERGTENGKHQKEPKFILHKYIIYPKWFFVSTLSWDVGQSVLIPEWNEMIRVNTLRLFVSSPLFLWETIAEKKALNKHLESIHGFGLRLGGGEGGVQQPGGGGTGKNLSLVFLPGFEPVVILI